MTNRATTPRLNLRHVATLLSGLPGVAAGWGLWAATGSSSFQGEPGNYSLLWQFPPVLFGVAISTALAVLSALLVFRDRPQQPHSLGSIVIHHFRSPCSLLYLWALPLFALLPAVALVPLAAGGLRRLGWVTIPLTLYPIVRAALPRQASGAVARLHRNWSAAFGIVIVIFLAGWARISSNLLDRLQPTGDEPHYLRQIESLLQDFDLDLANNVPGYCPAWPPDWCRLHHTLRTPDGTLRSIHSPGLPLLLAIPVRFGGRSAALGALALFGCAAALASYWTCHKMDVPPLPTTAAVISLLGAVPFLPFTTQIYPELPAASIIAVVVYFIASRRNNLSRELILGALLGALPWFHIKYALLSILLYALSWFARPFTRRSWFAVSLPAGASALALLFFYWRLYGTYNPFHAYREYAQETGMFSLEAARGSLIMLLDGHHGLLVFTPILALVPWGAAHLFRRQPRLTAGLIVTAVIYFLMTASHASYRWLGWSPPARFLVPVIPLVLPLLAAAFNRLRGKWPTGMAILLSAYGMYIATLMMRRPESLHDRSLLWKLLSDPEFNIAGLLPISYPNPSSLASQQFLFLALLITAVACIIAIDSHHHSVQIVRLPTQPMSHALWQRPGFTLLSLLIVCAVAPVQRPDTTAQQKIDGDQTLEQQQRLATRSGPVVSRKLRALSICEDVVLPVSNTRGSVKPPTNEQAGISQTMVSLPPGLYQVVIEYSSIYGERSASVFCDGKLVAIGRQSICNLSLQMDFTVPPAREIRDVEIRWMSGPTEQARLHYLIRLNPERWAEELVRVGNHDDAQKQLATACNLRQTPRSWGLLRRAQGRLLEAVACMELAVEQQPRSLTARCDLLETYLQRQMWDQALDLISQLRGAAVEGLTALQPVAFGLIAQTGQSSEWTGGHAWAGLLPRFSGVYDFVVGLPESAVPPVICMIPITTADEIAPGIPLAWSVTSLANWYFFGVGTSATVDGPAAIAVGGIDPLSANQSVVLAVPRLEPWLDTHEARAHHALFESYCSLAAIPHLKPNERQEFADLAAFHQSKLPVGREQAQ